ncbi:MAG: prepilin peptidase [Labilithrix sp.]|nr:prepilin peptidase [Labilithrix sp.]MCW5810035.1 prepilin peptidase [Labilithrix sp.]
MRLDELLRLTPDSWALLPLWLARAFVFAFGLLWGSFLNVVIYRLPRDMSVVRPGSHCPGCGKPIAGYDNIPVLTYVILRGRSRCCGTKISPRYPLVELMGGMLSLAVFEVLVLSLPGATPAHRALAIYGADFTLCLGLVAAAFIDAEFMILPDSITIGGAVLGVATASLRDLGMKDALIGATVGFVGLWFPFTFLYKGLLGRTGMGLGDAKLIGLAGAWFGWPGAVVALFAGAFQGTIATGIAYVAGWEPSLPSGVREDIAQLEADAAAGDEEAKKALAEDPLTEEEDAFILRFFRRLFGIPEPEPELDLEGPPTEEEHAEMTKPPRARIPFGPFLILAILELLFAGDWLKSRIGPFLWPVL